MKNQTAKQQRRSLSSPNYWTRRSIVMTVLLSLITWSTTISQVSAARARVVVVGDTQWAYPGEVAAFGNRLSGKTYSARLVLPPKEYDSKYLCNLEEAQHELHKSLVMDPTNDNRNKDNVFEEQPIALLVKRGDCPFDQKAQNALYLQQHLSSRIMYLFVYNNDETAPNDLVIMSASSKEENGLEEYNSIGLIFLSTASGEAILDRMETIQSNTGYSPYYQDDSNDLWDMFTYFERMVPANDNGSGNNDDTWNSREGSTSMGGNTFYWLRFILFALLIISPCVRAGYLWYVGGGRVHVRRSEEGRFAGFMYVRPQPYWFASGPEHQPEHEISDCLTEEQVNALPEIIFKKQEEVEEAEEEIKNGDGKDLGQDNANKTDEATQNEQEEDIAIEPDEEQPQTTSTQQQKPQEEQVVQTETTSSAATVTDTSNSNSGSGDDPSRDITCTTCSICIDDFEDGEKLRLLPRCRHVFHTECIMPWLTERQGCCPLCKTSVMENENDDTTHVDLDVEEQPQQQENVDATVPTNGNTATTTTQTLSSNTPTQVPASQV